MDTKLLENVIQKFNTINLGLRNPHDIEDIIHNPLVMKGVSEILEICKKLSIMGYPMEFITPLISLLNEYGLIRYDKLEQMYCIVQESQPKAWRTYL